MGYGYVDEILFGRKKKGMRYGVRGLGFEVCGGGVGSGEGDDVGASAEVEE